MWIRLVRILKQRWKVGRKCPYIPADTRQDTHNTWKWANDIWKKRAFGKTKASIWIIKRYIHTRTNTHTNTHKYTRTHTHTWITYTCAQSCNKEWDHRSRADARRRVAPAAVTGKASCSFFSFSRICHYVHVSLSHTLQSSKDALFQLSSTYLPSCPHVNESSPYSCINAPCSACRVRVITCTCYWGMHHTLAWVRLSSFSRICHGVHMLLSHAPHPCVFAHTNSLLMYHEYTYFFVSASASHVTSSMQVTVCQQASVGTLMFRSAFHPPSIIPCVERQMLSKIPSCTTYIRPYSKRHEPFDA